MTATAENVDLEKGEVYEGETLDDLHAEWEAEQSEAEAEANKPDPEDLEKARKLAEKMNDGFLWMVNRTQCPHVAIDQIVEREKGVEALEPLAERWGGEVPEWVQQFSPYIGAGIYMASTIVTARQMERQVVEAAKAQQKQQQGADHGEEPATGTAE